MAGSGSASRRFAFLFVAQAGELEVKAALLAASLRRNLRVPGEVVACVPEPAERWGALPETTRALLARLGVRVAPIRNEIADDYPIGNKVSCLRVPCDAAKLVFVDSDVLCVSPFHDEPRFDLPLHVKPADEATFDDLRAWKRAYAVLGLPMTEARIVTSVSGETVPPYYNAGWIGVDAAAGFGDAWLDACRRIDAKWGIPRKRPNLDQIALPVAAQKLGLATDVLDERYNFPAHRKPIDSARVPFFAHYHKPQVIRREPILADLVRSLCEEEPALGDLLRAHEGWGEILRPARRAVVATASPSGSSAATTVTPDVIVTGIPRSGTSYLCNLLHRYDNCVVLNEPEEITHALRHEATPWTVPLFLRDRRRDVVEGVPIRNKLKDGKVTDDTVGANSATEYTPRVTSDDFVIGAKNPLGFLARFDDLRRAMPGARIAICVRDPFDTVASFKDSFEHLREADVASLKVGGLKQRFISSRRRRELEAVAEIESPAWRRAAWWRYLAGLVLDAVEHPRAGVVLVPYRTLVERPMDIVGPFLSGLPAGGLTEPIEPSKVRKGKRSGLDAEDLAAIRSLCRERAELLGVWDE